MASIMLVAMIGSGFTLFLLFAVPVAFFVIWLVKQVKIYRKYKGKDPFEHL